MVLLNGMGFVRVGLVGAWIGEVGLNACRRFWICAGRHVTRAGVLRFSFAHRARTNSYGICMMTCALLRCKTALGVEYEHCGPCVFFLHGSPRSPLGTAARPNAMYRSGFSPWSLDFFQVWHCTEKTYKLLGLSLS